MKRRNEGRWDLAWGGIASLGLALPVMWTALGQRGFTAEKAAERVGRWMGTETARLAGLTGQKGALAAGFDADFVVFDPNVEWTVAAEHLRFRHKLSPYLGAELKGRVLETWIRGQKVFGEDEFAEWPRGRELVRQ
jgi:allantoinase